MMSLDIIFLSPSVFLFLRSSYAVLYASVGVESDPIVCVSGFSAVGSGVVAAAFLFKAVLLPLVFAALELAIPA